MDRLPFALRLAGLGMAAVVLAGCSPRSPMPDAADEAEAALAAYFGALHGGRYEEAAALYGGSYDQLLSMNPSVDPTKHGQLFELYCTVNGGQCLPVKTILEREAPSEDSFTFVVQFLGGGGGVLELGPCCGEPDTGQRLADFTYTVQRIDGTFTVLELPPYIP